MDQLLTYILSAVGILGFFLAGKKIWWAWYVNIANQALWLFFSILTQQWGFLLATGFYLIVFIRNAILWTRDRPSKKTVSPNGMVLETNPKPPVEGPVGPAGGYSEEPSRKDQMIAFMKYEGTDPAVSNEIAQVITEVFQAEHGEDHYVRFTERYSIAHEIQRRLDVRFKGTRPDVKAKIMSAINEIDRARQMQFETRNIAHNVNQTSWVRVTKALGFAYETLEDLLKGDYRVKETGSSAHARDSDRNSGSDHI